MPRVTYVKSARQRFETVVVRNEDGTPKRVPMTRKDGSQIVTKRGPKFLTITVQDRSKPKPNLRCDFPGCAIDGGEILPGTPYKWIKPKSGPYGGRQRNRHATHPSWRVWEYSSSLDARLAQIADTATSGYGDWESVDDVESAANDAASEVESLADEWDEKQQAVEDGFGHETTVSEELGETAEGLRDMASELESVTIPDAPDEDDYDRDEDGEELDDPSSAEPSDRYNDSGESYADALEAWREEALEALQQALERQF